MRLPKLVDPHSNQEDDKITVDPSRDATCDNLGHRNSLGLLRPRQQLEV
jgi:hypothetical protein